MQKWSEGTGSVKQRAFLGSRHLQAGAPVPVARIASVRSLAAAIAGIRKETRCVIFHS